MSRMNWIYLYPNSRIFQRTTKTTGNRMLHTISEGRKETELVPRERIIKYITFSQGQSYNGIIFYLNSKKNIGNCQHLWDAGVSGTRGKQNILPSYRLKIDMLKYPGLRYNLTYMQTLWRIYKKVYTIENVILHYLLICQSLRVF